jgi:TonB family protein
VVILTTMMMAVSLAAPTGGAHAPRRARANLNQYFTTDDYPQEALARHGEGTTLFRIEIDAQGNVTRCLVTHTSGDAALDAATCSVLKTRAHYEPARDSRGRAVPGKDEGRVTWRLPDSSPPQGPPPLILTRTLSRLHGDGHGALTCTVLVNGRPAVNVQPDQCGSLRGGGVENNLRSAPASGDVTMVWVAGPADAAVEAPQPDEAALGTRAFNLLVAMDVGEDGRIATCRNTGREALPELTLRVPDICSRFSIETPPVFAPAAGPRQAKMRMTLYLNGWAVQGLTAPASPHP